ncbi:tachykinin 1 like protein [Labeo rohita]|uniref:Tachykinin 1 like protein n=1 Tax=Labeo rohita TaxID=84645 RepID=A0A498LME0_LABRO|nr:tachykinin 1 like protein [Labeo rohita]RXN20237.1 tachykinin 1 like protein [Labeo rohita]
MVPHNIAQVTFSTMESTVRGGHKDEWLQADPFREILRRMTRKPRPHQFIGLMGKRSSGHKINSFVGLMGKRSQEEPESYEWGTVQIYDKRR